MQKAKYLNQTNGCFYTLKHPFVQNDVQMMKLELVQLPADADPEAPQPGTEHVETEENFNMHYIQKGFIETE